MDAQTRALLIAAWVEDLADIPDEILIRVARECELSAETWMPTSGKLRERAVEICGLDPSAMAERAWEAVLDYDHGHGTPLTDDLARITMQRIGGWEAWHQVHIDDVHWWHERFVKAYAESFGRQTAGMPLPPGDDKASQLIAEVAKRLTGATKQIGGGNAKHQTAIMEK